MLFLRTIWQNFCFDSEFSSFISLWASYQSDTLQLRKKWHTVNLFSECSQKKSFPPPKHTPKLVFLTTIGNTARITNNESQGFYYLSHIFLKLSALCLPLGSQGARMRRPSCACYGRPPQAPPPPPPSRSAATALPSPRRTCEGFVRSLHQRRVIAADGSCSPCLFIGNHAQQSRSGGFSYSLPSCASTEGTAYYFYTLHFASEVFFFAPHSFPLLPHQPGDVFRAFTFHNKDACGWGPDG